MDSPWSIIPIDGCASVDNGLVTFKECAIGKTYIVTYKNGMCESKTTINVTGESACKCTDLVVSGDKTIESDANTDIEIGTYTAGCVTDITASTSADWVTSISTNNDSIKASVKGNISTTEPNTAIITVTGKAGSDTCTKTFTLTQKAKESDPCDRFEVTGVEALTFYDATYTIANFTIDVATDVGVVNSTLPEWVLSSSVVVDNDNGEITAFIERNRDGKEPVREKEITVTGKVGTETCTKKFTLKQKKEYNRSCYRGTDNGADRYEDGSTRMRPTLLCGENGSYRQDSIYIENGDSGNLQYKLNGGSWMTFGGSGFNPAAWVHVGFDTIVGCCSNKFMKIVAQSQCNVSDCIPGEYYRSVKFSFRKKNYQEGDLVPQCAGTGTCDGPANEKLCDEWEYEIKQCAVGYYWAADSEQSMHSYNAYPAKCGSGKLVYWGCDCSTPVVCDCSALKVSGIESVPSSGYEAETTLARYTSDTSCGTVSKPTFVDGSGVDFVVWSTPTTTKLKGKVSENKTSSERKATYKLTQGDCNTEFEIKQEAGSEQGCDVSVTLSGDMDEGDTVKLKWGISQNLIDIGKNQTKTYHLNSNTEMIKATLSDPNNKYDLTPSTKTLKCSDNEMNVIASKKTTACTCDNANVQIGTTAITLGYTAGSTAETTYSHVCTVTIDNTASDWIEVTEDTNKLKFKALGETASTRTGTIYIKDANRDNCETISVSQDPLPPAAHTFSFKFKYYDYEEGPMVTGDYNRYTGYDVTDFEVDGQPATMQVEVYYRRSFYDKSVQDCAPTSAQNYTGGTSDSSVQSYLEGTEWCGGSLIHVNGFMVKYNGIVLKQMQGHDSELDGTYEGEFS